MALVKCPECGKNNISDSATTCPSCGYGIKEHFELIRQETQFVEQQQQKQEKLQNELKKELERIDSMPRPYKPTLGGILFSGKNWGVLVFGFIAALWLLLAILYLFTGDSGGLVYLFIGGLFAAFTYIYGKGIKENYDNAISKYENWDRYKECLKNDTINRYETWINDLKKHKFEVQKTITPAESTPTPRPTYGLKCPICNSRNVKRISNTSRAISVELMGLASSKIAKQYQCKDCKHMW